VVKNGDIIKSRDFIWYFRTLELTHVLTVQYEVYMDTVSVLMMGKMYGFGGDFSVEFCAGHGEV
jgi:hypothetical protein